MYKAYVRRLSVSSSRLSIPESMDSQPLESVKTFQPPPKVYIPTAHRVSGSSKICIPNTVVVPSDAAVDEEKVVLTIRLFNKDLVPVYDATADISVEILDPDNDILRPHADDYTDKDGTYKVLFEAPNPGKYIAHIMVNGECINTAGYKFHATGQYSYNKRKHSFKSSPPFYSGNIPSRNLSRMTTGQLSTMNSPRLSGLLSSRSAKSDDILYRDVTRTSKGYTFTKPPSRLSVLDESVQQDVPLPSARSYIIAKDYNGSSKEKETITDRRLIYDDVNCINIAFDATVSHPSIDVARDSLTIGLKAIKSIYGSSPREHSTRRLRLYPGTLGTRSFRRPGLFYWEITVKYKILKLIRRNVLFEFGLARYDAIDAGYHNDRNQFAWVVSGGGCHLCGRVCLHGWHNGQMMSHVAFADRIPSPIRSYSKLDFGCLLDTSKRHWIIVDLNTRQVVANFVHLVVSENTEPLWPVFALYNPEQAHTTMEIHYGSDVRGIPEEALDALSI